MTEAPLQFTSTGDVKHWLEDQTAATLSPVHAQAKKFRDDMSFAIQSIADVSRMLLENSNREIEKRNMKVYNRARALNKLAHLFVDRLKKLTTPEEVSYESLSKYTQETQKIFLVMDIDIRNWFPRISPFFIMDRRKFLTTYERARQTYGILNDFVTKEYVKTKTLEEAFQLLSDLQNVQKQLETVAQEREQVRNELAPVEREIVELEQKIAELKTKGPIDKLNLVNSEIETVSSELKNTLRHFQKPFIKMQALATSGGGGGVTPDDLAEITQYLENPFQALAAEQHGYPALKELLGKLERFIEEDSLKLKDDKARKAEQSINEVLKQNSLEELQLKCQKLAKLRDDLLASAQLDDIRRCMAQLQEQLEQLKVRKASIESHQAVKENNYNEAVDKISNLKRSVERDVSSSISAKIQIA